MVKPGKFITFEGPECGGKSGVVPILAEHLRARGYFVCTTREPGGTPLADKLRDLLLHSNAMTGLTELLLLSAGRHDHVETYIKPALAKGWVVISDRFADSSYAYQGAGRGMKQAVQVMEEMVLNGFEPDYTLFFDIPLVESRRRMQLRKSGQPDRIESENDAFHERIYQGYQERLRTHHHRMVRIDALPKSQTVINSVLAWADAAFEKLN